MLFSVCMLCFTVFAHSYSIVDAPPNWRNQKQSALVIPQGGCVSLQAEGIDTVSLSKAVLSTNETGVWRNETEYASLWMQDAVYGFDNFGTATYEDGVLYAPSKGDDNVYAVNASNGNIIWNKTVRQCDASPYIDSDVIYVGECSGPYGEPSPFPRALALNKTNGEEVWHFTEPGDFEWIGSPLLYSDYVYYTTGGAGVYALNKTNGIPIWNRTEIGYVVCSVACHNGAIFVSSYDPPGQYALNATTGETIWHQNYGASWDSSPIVYDGVIIQVAVNRSIGLWSTYILNETNGGLIRKFDGKGSCSTPLVHDGKIFIPSNDWRMWAFNLTSGEELWHTVELHNGLLQNYSYSSPASAGEAIYYQALNGSFYVINETDGNILWSFALGSFGFGSPSIGDGCVFITNDFALYAFKIGPGFGDWTMFCQNNFHQSYLEHGVEYVRCPLTEPKDFKDSSNIWKVAKFVWRNKTITSAAIAWRIYFFDNTGNTNATDVKIFYVNMAIHNIAVVSVTPEETLITQNQTTSINVTVINDGSFTETFNVTLYFDSTEIDFQTLTLNSSESKVLTFEWNTTGVPLGNYELSANATIVPGEVEAQDNICILENLINVVPEFSSIIALLVALIISTSVAVVSFRKKKLKNSLP